MCSGRSPNAPAPTANPYDFSATHLDDGVHGIVGEDSVARLGIRTLAD